MVLTRWVGALLGCAFLGCLPRAPQVRVDQAMQVAVAYVRDGDDGSVSQVPDALKAKVAAALQVRNLQVQEIPLAQHTEAFRALRDSRRRLEEVSQGTEAPLVLLVETRARFFSQLVGRYRWTVDVKLTATKRPAVGDPVEDIFEVPAFLNFDHEREASAVQFAASTIAERVGMLLDGYLGASAAPRTSQRPRPASDAIYFVMVDRFANGDRANDGEVDGADPAAFHGGDLEGLIARLDGLQALGVRTVWLSPIFKMRTTKFHGYGAFHGYWVEDLNAIEPRFGDEATLRRLSAELHRRDMRLMLDLVLNHVGPDTPLVSARPDWFHREGPLVDMEDPAQQVSRDVMGLPDLAQEKPEVYRYLSETSSRWARVADLDGFRLDAVKHIALPFWARFNDELRARQGPSFWLLGEMLDGDPTRVAHTQKEGRFDAMFDFPLKFALVDVLCKGQSPARLGVVFSQDRLYPAPESLVTFLDNHDLPRVMSDCAGEVESVRQALTVQLTARGIPSLNYGTEEGLTGAKEPENRGDMRFTDHPLRQHIAQLLAARARHPSLREGAPRVLEAGPSRFVYARVASEEAAVVAVNRSQAQVTVRLPAELPGTATDLLSGEALHSTSVAVAPGAVRVVLVTPSTQGGFATEAERARAQWLTGAARREVRVEASGPGGQKVYLVGSGPELGGWNASRAVPLTASLSLPVGSVFEYKLFARTAAGEPRWEEGGNRTLFVEPGDAPLRMRVAWGERRVL